MFKKKYTPSVKANNEFKDKALSSLKVLIFNLEKGKITLASDDSVALRVAEVLNQDYTMLENSLGMGNENVQAIAIQIEELIINLKKSFESGFVNRVDSATDELSFAISSWSALLSGEIGTIDNDDELEKTKISWARKKLNAKLDELMGIKSSIQTNEKRLEKEIEVYEKDIVELEDMMLVEDNERKINDIFRKISGTKSKLEGCLSHHSNYSACYNLLDIIYSSAKEIVSASDFSIDELGKAKGLLNISKLQNVLSQPEKVIAILTAMQNDMKKISAKTKSIDEKVFGIGTNEQKVSDSALAYKEELMRKKREKESLSNAQDISAEKTLDSNNNTTV